MTNRLYTDGELAMLGAMPKQVVTPRARWVEKPGHRQRNFAVVGDGEARFSVYQRQNLRDEHDFSCGIAFLPPGGQRLTLARYNGPSHRHGDIAYRPHVHRATERAIAAGRKPESEAVETDRFRTLEGALACLIDDFNLGAVEAAHDQPGLFP